MVFMDPVQRRAGSGPCPCAMCGVWCVMSCLLHVGGVSTELCTLHHKRRMRWMGVVGKWKGEETNKWALQTNAKDEGTMLNKFRTKG